jgi:hypothetical protein
MKSSNEKRAENDKRVERDIRKYGCHVISVFDPEGKRPSFTILWAYNAPPVQRMRSSSGSGQSSVDLLLTSTTDECRRERNSNAVCFTRDSWKASPFMSSPRVPNWWPTTLLVAVDTTAMRSIQSYRSYGRQRAARGHGRSRPRNGSRAISRCSAEPVRTGLDCAALTQSRGYGLKTT